MPGGYGRCSLQGLSIGKRLTAFCSPLVNKKINEQVVNNDGLVPFFFRKPGKNLRNTWKGMGVISIIAPIFSWQIEFMPLKA